VMYRNPAEKSRPTCLDAGGVLELVARGALTRKLPVSPGYSGRAIGADTGVAVSGQGETQQAAGLVSTSVTA